MTPMRQNKHVIPIAAWVVAATVFTLTALALVVFVTRGFVAVGVMSISAWRPLCSASA